jgi:glutamate-ammonia-ligase adenylyltransferase
MPTESLLAPTKPTSPRRRAARFRLPAVWPAPADTAAAGRFAGRVAELGRVEARLAGAPTAAAMLACLGGNSPYLADLALRERAALRRIVADGPDAVFGAEMDTLRALPADLGRAELAAALRRAKRVASLAIAVADIGCIWKLARITEALSDLAEAALRASVAYLLADAREEGRLRDGHEDPASGSQGGGFVVLGMGKLGARELNYSSDIDLILLHDPDAATDPDSAGALFTRIARGLVALMDARDADGYVFRTDLRLRPDPAATPPSIALPAAIAYYESMGQNWERAAMIKARPVAGDIALGQDFLAAIRPFVWRRGLDFAAVADIHAMKRRIDAHRKTSLGAGSDPVTRVVGFHIKLGEGGIREIEFLAQTLQLVWGGRDPALREPRTLDALRLLARARRIARRAAAELIAAYRFLRRIEHRLQMVADRQTHSLPDSIVGLEAFALFAGYANATCLANALLLHLDRVRAVYGRVFRKVPLEASGTAGGKRLEFAGPEDAPETVGALSEMGYEHPEAVIAAVRGWLAGRVRALRSHRARDLMSDMLPVLLGAIGRQSQPDTAFRRFEAFLAGLPAGVQLLSLFERNPALLDRVADVLGAAPSLAEHLARCPSALEGLLAPDEAPDIARDLTRRLSAAPDLEDAIDRVRATVRAEDFRISIATMEARLDTDAAGIARAALADAALAALLPAVLADFSARHGRVRGGGLAVVLLGKGGGREMMAGSDLDLMLVYDHPPEVTESSGGSSGRRMAASQWFIRAVHAYVAALIAPDSEGPMYEVDMRLRPSGNKGPVAVSLAAFEAYHAPAWAEGEAHIAGAWTWERMALTRARVVAGPAALRARIQAAIRAAIGGAGPPARIREDIAAMRARLLRDLPPTGPWDVKLRPGGQIEVEFIAQALQLIHPHLVQTTTSHALAALRDAGMLPAADAALLIRADWIWRTVQGMLRITSGRRPGEHLPEPSAERLLRAASLALGEGGASDTTLDVPALRATLEIVARDVRAAFVRHVGEIVP